MINGTLLVQVVNFIGAYYLLRFFFIKPIYAVIEQEDGAQKKQHDALLEKKNKLQQQLVLKREAWLECQHYFMEHRPKTVTKGVQEKKREAVVEIGELPQGEIQKMQKDVTKFIIAKVEHG